MKYVYHAESRAWHTDHLLLSHRVTERATGAQCVTAGYRQMMEEIQRKSINCSLMAPPPSPHSRPALKRHGVGGGGEEGLTTLSLGLGSGAAAFTGRSAQRLPAILSPPSRGRWVLLAASSPPPESVPPAQKSITLAAQVYTGMP